MILYRKEPYPIQMKNIMLLDDAKSGGVVYVNQTTYDQALMLSARLDGDPKRVLDILKSPKTEVYRTIYGLKGLVEEMMSSMPKPINMLAPFLIFCVQNQGIEWDAEDREFAYGILHYYSMLTDLNQITLVPAEVRNNISIPTAVLKAYQTSWDDLCSTLKDNVVMGAVQTPVIQQVAQPVQQTAPTATVQTTQVATPAPASQGPVSEEDRLADFAAKMIAEAEEEERKRKAEKEARKAEREAKRAAAAGWSATATTAASTPAPASASASASEAAKSNAILSEFDI